MGFTSSKMVIEKEFQLNDDKLNIRIFDDSISFFIQNETDNPDWWKPLPLGDKTDEIVKFINKNYKIQESKSGVRFR